MRLFKQLSVRCGRHSAKADRIAVRLKSAGFSGRTRQGFTLLELLISLMITSLLAVVLSAMMMAMQTAAEFIQGHEGVHSQGTVSLERIRFMVSQAGTCKMAGKPTQLGIKVVERDYGSFSLPQILVVWSGGRSGGMIAQGVQTRLPRTDELVIYAPDPGDPTQFTEIVSTASPKDIDFSSDQFAAAILAIVDGQDSDRLLLCDRLRGSTLSARVGSAIIGNVRFDLFETPTAAELSGVTPGSSAWYDLVWAQGIVTSDSGLRQTTVAIELQLETRDNAQPSSSFTETSLPCYGSVSQRYVYRP